jgi:hypothetical protein
VWLRTFYISRIFQSGYWAGSIHEENWDLGAMNLLTKILGRRGKSKGIDGGDRDTESFPLERPVPVPNLFLLGAGKCGTTSLYHILGQHPQIHVSHIKEPSFFCSYFQDVRNPITYFQLFDSKKKYRMDSSHVYFSNPETASILRALFPNAKFIVILREPKNRAYALFRHMRRYNHSDGQPFEELADFVQALNAEEERYASKHYFENCRQYFWNFMYCRSSYFDNQLSRYFSLFERKNFHILTLSELAFAPSKAIQGTLDFLDVDRHALDGLESTIFNADDQYPDYSPEAAQIMDQKFLGLRERVEQLVGRKLDWTR